MVERFVGNKIIKYDLVKDKRIMSNQKTTIHSKLNEIIKTGTLYIFSESYKYRIKKMFINTLANKILTSNQKRRLLNPY